MIPPTIGSAPHLVPTPASRRGSRPAVVRNALAALVALVTLSAAGAAGAPPDLAPLQAVPVVEVDRYLGTWYQVAWFPNRFQRQCVRDTAATYSRGPGDTITVRNACRMADGRVDDVIGQAQPVGRIADGRLQPAQLRVSFLPSWLRWTGIGWGRYWVIELPDDYRYAVVSEPTREYLWVLAREPRLSDADRAGIRARLAERGFDLARWQDHPHGGDPVR
jgi:apolipoprotein D and lipocalin family protein